MQPSHDLDIEAPVGKNTPNRRDDVTLVQYMLAVWMAHEKTIAKLAPRLANTLVMTIDGVCGEKTNKVIDTFEVFHQPSVNRDGRIDPAFQTISTRKMFLLNQILFFAGGLPGGIPQTRIPFPPSLAPLLYR